MFLTSALFVVLVFAPCPVILVLQCWHSFNTVGSYSTPNQFRGRMHAASNVIQNLNSDFAADRKNCKVSKCRQNIIQTNIWPCGSCKLQLFSARATILYGTVMFVLNISGARSWQLWQLTNSNITLLYAVR